MACQVGLRRRHPRGRARRATTATRSTATAATPTARATGCGNGIQTAGEACDDGNLVDGDGCDANCTVTGCGNGIQSASEPCDDGNVVNGDGCDNNCTPTACGNGVQTVGESCDDGNLTAGDGCRADCTPELCGDTVLDPGEQCDDGNLGRRRLLLGRVRLRERAALRGRRPLHQRRRVRRRRLRRRPDRAVDQRVRLRRLPRSAATRTATSSSRSPGRRAPISSGYQIISVEGKSELQHALPLLITAGNAHFTRRRCRWGPCSATTPGRASASWWSASPAARRWHVGQGDCDLVLPAPFTDTNLQNGNLLNSDGFSCPDGILLRDPLGAVRRRHQLRGSGAERRRLRRLLPRHAVQRRRRPRVEERRLVREDDQHAGAGDVRGRVASRPAAARSPTSSSPPASRNRTRPGATNPGQSLHCAELFCGDGVAQRAASSATTAPPTRMRPMRRAGPTARCGAAATA